MTRTFVERTVIDAPLEAVWTNSLSIDVHLASMRRSSERAVAGVVSGLIGLDETVTWRARHFGLWFEMTSRITELDPYRRFVDEQTTGPFQSFRHEHEFTWRQGHTEMVDIVHLASPILPRSTEAMILLPYMRRLIRQRNAHLVRSSEPSAPSVPQKRPSSSNS